MYKAVLIEKGQGGWGGPLVIKPTEEKVYIMSVTGGGIHPVAQKIADLTGGIALDGFSSSAPDSEVACVVVDCGGTARCGVYPKKGIFTINLTPVGQAGPLAQYIKEDIYVSGVKENNITLYNGEVLQNEPAKKKDYQEVKAEAKAAAEKQKGFVGFISRIGKAVGGVVGKFYQAGRESIDMVIKNVLPFMAFIAMLIGIITVTGLGDVIANTISPFAGTLPGLVLISIVCTLPFLSPILGPGAVIAQVVGTLVGVQIGAGAIAPALALPALFAIDGQVGCDFIPVGLSLGEAETETVEIGVPAVLFSRLITGPAAVLIGFALSIGMYS
ncbi:PTS glucitol/sorbitol transporter subunit IIB [Acetobacterium wieringae]|uniref:PTS glucitol/sorbitol transporter subunit IIB n=1 Tax=Acetobacterium wieringae TaxID=52694 RepID=A0ABY6HG30_9FIRM|nr:PTS glucitol/sorbitol transporter subunit IIB [Acetobacterium wieringae]UYO63445.1 PTS glucitol/sorbitol transporter subunit IIB [Acetobacterium wieringae]VUZ27155.1 PTS system glucitol/sorbitol-specific EIIB component [Acetobacterium wieringae]